MRLATTESYLDRQGARQERTEWHRIAVWGKRAEALAKFLQKGDKLFVEGRIRTSTYEKNGEKRYSTEIHAENIILGGGKRQAPQSQTSQAPQSQMDDIPVDDGTPPEDDIPF